MKWHSSPRADHAGYSDETRSDCETEFEYKRNGTQSLIASFNVATGEIAHATVGATRTEADLAHIEGLVNQNWKPQNPFGHGLLKYPSIRSVSPISSD
jgi:hypothetical protein